jgi:hypothetical protein
MRDQLGDDRRQGEHALSREERREDGAHLRPAAAVDGKDALAEGAAENLIELSLLVVVLTPVEDGVDRVGVAQDGEGFVGEAESGGGSFGAREIQQEVLRRTAEVQGAVGWLLGFPFRQ